jgi:nucleotide-binding universal stress UspA family protein
MPLEVGQMRRPVVVAVDGSEASLRAAEWAACEAQRRQAPLRIVAAPGLPPRMRAYETSSVTVANALRGLAARGLAAAVERVSELAPAVMVDTDLLDGPPALAVSASGSGAELLVVGARGSGGFSALVLGSVSRHVASYAPCPAVVVREETAPVHREIVVGVRDPDDSSATLDFAFEAAALRRARLLVVHAVSLPIAAAGLPPAAASAVAAVAAESERRLGEMLNRWREKYPDVEARVDVVRSHPAHILASLSARADLVVVGRHGAPGGPGGSSIQHAVLGHASGPVAIVPSAD